MSRDRFDDDDYDIRPQSGESGPLDGMFANTNIIILVLFGLCCGIIAFVLALAAYLTAKNPDAKSKALIVMVISGVMMAIGVVLNVAGVLAGIGR